MGKTLRTLKRLFFLPMCRGCGDRQSIFGEREPLPLCPDCLKRWDAARRETCAACGKEWSDCTCLPETLRTVGCTRLVRLVPYRSGQHGVAERIIFICKEKRDRELFDFLGEALCDPVRAALGNDTDVTVTWVPRRRIAVQQYGHDQAQEIAMALGRALGIGHTEAIRRRSVGGSHVEQKMLTAPERIEAAKKSFAAISGKSLAGKTAILVDDVCTTGASLAACCSLLRDEGAARVICVTVAGTVQRD